ncbi:MAG: DUF459 domain-containing protein [Beijerinckiaceae bacterium]
MRRILRPSRRLILICAALFAALAGLLSVPDAAQAQTYEDESSPAVFWRLERQRQEARRKPPVVIQRPTRMTRGVAPRRGFTREVPADSAAAAAAAAANTAADASATAAGDGTQTPALNAAVQPVAPAGPPFVIGVFGDNVGQMLAQGVNEAYAARNVTVVRRARENTGLVRDDYYDWPRAVQDFLASDQKIDLAVMMIGSNDRQAIREGGQSHDVLSDKWKEIYRARALAIAEAFQKKGVPLIWVGMTVMKNERLSADLAQFNEIYREAAQKAGAVFVDVWEPFVDERNRFTLSGPDINGHVTRIRTGDGVHFTRAGARKLAHFIEGDVKRHLDQRSPAAPAIADVATPAPQGADVDAAAPAGATGPGGIPLPVPAPAVAPTPARPVAGPVMPLTASAVSPGGELATRPAAPRGAGSMVDGVPPDSRAGRADDFRWPRQ